MSFDIYIEEMKRLGWKEEDLKKDYELHENEIKSGQEFPWFPTLRPPIQKQESKCDRTRRRCIISFFDAECKVAII